MILVVPRFPADRMQSVISKIIKKFHKISGMCCVSWEMKMKNKLMLKIKAYC